MTLCPNCNTTMTATPVDVFITSKSVEVDTCTQCRLFWFDQYESTSLTPKAVLSLFQLIGTVAAGDIVPLASRFGCPRCQSVLEPTRDLQRTTSFTYWRCSFNHGRLTAFSQFLREKNFIRTPSPAELARLRETVRQISCSQCGAPIDLAKDSACSHCRAPIALIDPDSVAKAMQQLSAAALGPHAQAPTAEVARIVLNDAQIEALFELERGRTRGERDDGIDVLAVGVKAIGALLGAFLASS